MKTTARKPERRNLFVTIPDKSKARLKHLAKQSKMTLEGYVVAVLEEAIRNEDAFIFVKKEQQVDPTTSD